MREATGPNFEWREQLMAEEVNTHNVEEPNSEAKEFYEMLKSAGQPLYNGCDKSRMSATIDYQILKSDSGMEVKHFNRLMKQTKGLLPNDNLLLDNYYQTKKFVRKLGLSYVKIHACANDCILYYAEYKDILHCPVCGHERFKQRHGESSTSRRRGVPYKQLRYFPITPRLQ